jgi:hypothetical protein
MRKIIYNSWGIGYYDGKDIYINKLIKEYPEIHNYVLEHEKKHVGEKGSVSIFDLQSILTGNTMLSQFVRKHPKLFFQQICPLWIEDKELNVNWFLIYFWLFILLIIGAIFFLFFIKFN